MSGVTFYFEFEVTFMIWLQNLLGAFGGTVAGLVTSLGEELVYVLILGFVYWSYDKQYGIYVGENLMAGLLFNPLIKNLVLRRRPYMDHAEIKCLKSVDGDADLSDIRAQGYSFPSGHSTNAAVAYGSLAVYGKRRWLTVTASVLIFLIGFSRICLGVHYPTDVLCGWLLGGAVILLMAFLRRLIKSTTLRYLVVLLLALPGCFYCDSNDYYTALGMSLGFFLAVLFERRYVNFTKAQRMPCRILRVLLGLLLFVALNAVLKLLLGFLPLYEYLLRVLRYGIDVFVLMGVYPLTFRYLDRLFPERKAEKA